MLDVLFSNISYIGIIALLIAGAILPIPEELVVIAAGLAASYHQLNPYLAFAACLGGALAGDCILYTLGYHFGHGILRETRFFGGFLRPERELRVERMIRAHGLKVLFGARFLVGLRSTAYLAAGILRMPFRRFVAVDVACATSVIGLVFTLSYLYAWRLGNLWGLFDMIRDAEVAFTVLIVLAVAAVILFYWRRHQRRLARIRQKQQRRADRHLALLKRQETGPLAETESQSTV
jgi:membrane protein DedA with SNARE-associated domain